MKNLKKFLSLLLALVMCLSMLPVPVFAVETPEHEHNQDGWVCTQAEGTRTLICETVEHEHTEACYTPGEAVLACEEEHEHTEECYTPGEAVLACEAEEHTHGDACYTVTEGEWTCEAPEADETPAEVQAFLDAVDALSALAAEDEPDDDALLEAQNAVIKTYDALSEDQKSELGDDYAQMVAGLKEPVSLAEEVTYINASNVPVGNFYCDLHEDGTAMVVGGSAANGEINIPDIVTYNDVAYRVTAIGDGAFFSNGEYARVTLPEGLETIGDKAFCRVFLTNTELYIPDSVTTIGPNAFLYFNDGKEGANVAKIVLGKNVKTIGAFAFYTKASTPSLKVECGAAIESIDRSAFYNKAPYNVSSVTVNGPKYSLDTVLKSVTGFKNAEISYTQGVDTSNINSIVALREAIKVSEGPTTLTITADYIFSGKESSIIIPAGKDITIRDDGEKRIIEATYGLNAPLFVVEEGGKLTLDGTKAENLKFNLNNNSKFPAGKASGVQVQGEFVLKNAFIPSGDINGDGMTHGVVVVDDGGKFTMTGGVIKDMYAKNVGLTAAVVVTEGGTFDMSGGVIKNNKVTGSPNYAAGGVLLFTWNPNETPAKMTMSGDARIENNENEVGNGGSGGGGITLVGDAELIMNGGSVIGNQSYGNHGCNGGGICVAGPTQPMQITDGYEAKCVFTMTGGEISGNFAQYGGGIYVNSNHVTLNAGTISGNQASQTGGGLYVETPRRNSTGTKVNNAVVYGNTASYMGGGLYFCPTGSLTLSAFEGVGIFDNNLDGSEVAGADLASVVVHLIGSGNDKSATLVSRMLGGGKVDWYRDGDVEEILAGGWGRVVPEVPRYDPANPVLVAAGTHTNSMALKAIVTDGAKELAMNSAELFITGNTATRGGGIGCNGAIVAGEVDPSEWNVTVDATKFWADDVAEKDRVPVTLELRVDGQAVETVVLSKENDWKCEFTGLPSSAKTIEVVEITEGYAVTIVKKEVNGTVKGIEGVKVENAEGTRDMKEETITAKITAADSDLKIISSSEENWSYTIKGPAEAANQSYTYEVVDNAAQPAARRMMRATVRAASAGEGGTVLFRPVPDSQESAANVTIPKGKSILIKGLPAGVYTISGGKRVAFTVTNSKAISLTVNKVWVNDNGYNVRPDQVSVQLYDNGVASGEPVVLNSGNSWSYTWQDLPATGHTYTVGEVKVPDNYTSSQATSEDGTITITNTYTPPYVPPTTTTYRVSYSWTGLPEGTTARLPGSNRYAEGAKVTVNSTYYKDRKLTVDGTVYVFSGWDMEDFRMPGHDVVIKGVWTVDIPGENPPTTDIPDENPPLANVDDKLNTTDHFAYIIGYPEGDVRPEANMTRAEAVTVFFRLLTDEYRTENWSKENGYPDVKASDWFNNAISTATKAGIFKGDSEGTARPNDPVTRAEFAALAARFISDQITDDGTGDFADTVGHWAAHEIRLAVKAGWIKGVGGNKFEPDRYITRAEVMTLVNRMLDRVANKDHMLPDMIKWPDNMDTSAWYYEDVQEATNGHDYERLEDGMSEKWTQMQQPRDWEALEKEWSTAESGK